MLSTVSGDLLGVPLQYSDAEIAEIMSPRHFVEVRTTPGGPAPAETTRALQESRTRLADRSRVAGRDARGDRACQRGAESPERGAVKIEPTYVRVLVVWVAVLAALYLLQEYFS